MTPPREDRDEQAVDAAEPVTRRRRRRGSARPKQSAATQPDSAPAPVPEPPGRGPRPAKSSSQLRNTAQAKDSGPARDSASGRDRDSERGWRDLAGNSPSQVGPVGAMRARDLNRPTAEDLAAAEREVVIVRRQWQPPETRPNR